MESVGPLPSSAFGSRLSVSPSPVSVPVLTSPSPSPSTSFSRPATRSASRSASASASASGTRTNSRTLGSDSVLPKKRIRVSCFGRFKQQAEEEREVYSEGCCFKKKEKPSCQKPYCFWH
ncbi:hypothetical protein BD770DRAFT_429056 [Pilaira anomala]|nr:hypothetical protein BD770DRAFT_429056 [Pilaira anomala]